MEREWFRDVEILQKYITNRSKTGGIFSKGRVFIFSDSNKQGFTIKAEYDEEDSKKVNLQKGRSMFYDENVFNLATVMPPNKYAAPVKLKDIKLSNLKTLLPYIPPEHKYFLNNIY